WLTAATEVEGVAPLSERVGIRDRDAHLGSATSSLHLLAYAGANLAGYAHLEAGAGGQGATAEVVVDPSHRRRGVGSALIRALEDRLAPEAGTLQLWSHGDLDGARALAGRAGY